MNSVSLMKTVPCQTKVVPKIVIKMDDQEVVFKIDHPLLQKMYPGVITMDQSVLGRELLMVLWIIVLCIIMKTLMFWISGFNYDIMSPLD